MDKAITYVGLDVHKETIAVALAEAGVRGDVREYGKVANTPGAVKALATKLSRVGTRASVLLRGRTLRLWDSASVDPRRA